MKGSVLILLGLINLTISIISQNGDPYHYGVTIQKLATQNNLVFVEHQIIQTIKQNPIKVFGLTAIPGRTYEDYKGQKAIILNSFMHPREIATFQMLKKVTQELILQYKLDPEIQNILKNSIILFLPYTNIDGVLSYQSLKNPKEKADSRKNMNYKYSEKCDKMDKGVDINRNFQYKFGTISTSKDPCSVQYRGEKPFSEKQSQAIRLLFEHNRILLAIDIHSYGNLWIYPYASDSSNKLIKTSPLYPLYQKIFLIMKNKGAKYQGCHDSLGYEADGVYIDWALSKNTLAFAFEIGSTFDEIPQKDIQKNIGIFMEMFKQVMNETIPKYKLVKTDKQLCLQSDSIVPFNYWMGQKGSFTNQYTSLQPQKNFQCIFKEDNVEYELRIEGVSLIKQIDLKQIQYERLGQQSRIQQFFILIGQGFAVFVLGGMLCGLTIFCQTWIGNRIFPAQNQEKQRLKDDREQENVKEVHSMVKDEFDQNQQD